MEQKQKVVKKQQEGIQTGGVKVTGSGKGFIVVCAKCKKTVKSITNNMCEDCYNEWFERGGSGTHHVGKRS